MNEGSQIGKAALDWLLENDEPSVRYRTLTELLGEKPSTRAARDAMLKIPGNSVVSTAFEPMAADGSWQYQYRDQPNRYLIFVTTSLSYVAELGLNRTDKRVGLAVEHLFSLQQSDGDFFRHYSCFNGLILRTLNRLGYGNDKRTVRLRRLLRNSIRHDGGFHRDRRPRRPPEDASPHKSCIKGSLKALLAFAEDPTLRRTQESHRIAEYFLKRDVCFRTDDRDTPVVKEITRLAFPITYRPGLIEAIYALSLLGHGHRPEMGRAWELLSHKKLDDGCFVLQRSFNWPNLRTAPKGKPSKWLTLYAYLAMKHKGVGPTPSTRTQGRARTPSLRRSR